MRIPKHEPTEPRPPARTSGGYVTGVLSFGALLAVFWFGIGEWFLRDLGSSAQVSTPGAEPGDKPVEETKASAAEPRLGPSAELPASLTSDAAKEELRKRGHYESLAEALAAARLAVDKIDPAGPHSRGAEYFASNPKQQLRAWFGRDGIELTSGLKPVEGEEPWSVQVKLAGVGRGGALVKPGTRTVTGDGPRVEIGDSTGMVTEWYENRGEGIEQGFTVYKDPQGSGPLEVVMKVEGTVRAELLPDAGEGGGVRFVDREGEPVVSYQGVKAWDATGRVLGARVERRGATELAIVTEDSGAAYPVVIDPLFASMQTRLIEESIDLDYFGSSLALSGQTALIGAPGDDTVSGADSGSAYVFVRDPQDVSIWRQEAQLTPGDGAAFDGFGSSVALSGNIALVGAPRNDTAFGEDAGSAYVFVRDVRDVQNSVIWGEEAQLTDGGGKALDQFGSSVSLSGDTALVGAPFTDTQRGNDAGSAHVFVREPDERVWYPQASLTASDGRADDRFGSSVALSGEAACVGAPLHDTSGGVNAGSAYVFIRDWTLWSERAKVVASDGAAEDRFGSSVSLSENTVLVGSPSDDTTRGGDSGSAYVFVRAGSNWIQQAKLTAGDGATGDTFGSAVALHGDVVLVGAPNDDTIDGGGDAGSAYFFMRTGGLWSEQAKRTAYDGNPIDRFGSAVALEGDLAMVGAALDDSERSTAYDDGGVYLFSRVGTSWEQRAKLTIRDGTIDDTFASSLALSGDTVLVGVPIDDMAYGNDGESNYDRYDAGSAYVFVLTGNFWKQQAKLTARDSDTPHLFGASVALSGDIALIGAPGKTGNAYIFVRRGRVWSQQAKLDSGDGASRDQFGYSVALDGQTALVGAPRANNAAGSAYVFVRDSQSWVRQKKLTDDEGWPGHQFGHSVALSGNTALIGAPGYGIAYVFVRDSTHWLLQDTLFDGIGFANAFGRSVALSGDTALVGAPSANNAAGSAYVFVRNSVTSSWHPQDTLSASNGLGGDHFGYSVAVSGDTAVIGTPFADTRAGNDAGSAYVFRRADTAWIEQLTLDPGVDSSAGDYFGLSVDLDGETVLAGSPWDHTSGRVGGSAYLFVLGDLPEITVQPRSQTVFPGRALTFSVTVTGHAPIRYLWRKNGKVIPGATGPSFTIASVASTDEGVYDVVVSNLGGVVTSAAATLEVNDLSLLSQMQAGPPPEARGFVTVNLEPAGLPSGWRFAGEQQWRSAGVPATGLTTGDRTIQYRPVPGYRHPEDDLVSVESGQAATVLNRTYTPIAEAPTGNLKVILLPQNLAGAQWRFPGEDDASWRDSGVTLTGLPAGNYLVEAKPVPGRSLPSSASVMVQAGQTAEAQITYRRADAAIGAQPSLVPFQIATNAPGQPFGYIGQIRSPFGSGTGSVVMNRVVLTAAHVVFDDASLSFVAPSSIQWLFQRSSSAYEPEPQTPRGIFPLSGYAAQRQTDGTPGESSPASQNLDVAALFFLESAGRGGSGGYLASDTHPNEWLDSPRQKILAGYPVDGIATGQQGEIFATAPRNVRFTPGLGATYVTEDITSSGGMSGAPLSVQYDDGNYFPAAIYLGGTAQTVVRTIDSEVRDLIIQANMSANGGDNNVGGGITLTSTRSLGNDDAPGEIQVTILPALAVSAGARWSIKEVGSSNTPLPRESGATVSGLSAGDYLLQLTSVSGFQAPEINTVKIAKGKLRKITFTYAPSVPAITSSGSYSLTRGMGLNYRITASGIVTRYEVVGTPPQGVSLDPITGLLSGTAMESGKFTVTVKAVNGTGSGTKAVDLIVQPELADQVASVGFGQPLHTSVVSGEAGAVFSANTMLPTGLRLDANTGVVSGVPLQSGVFVVPISVTVRGASATATLTLNIGPRLDSNGSASLVGQVNQPFSSTPRSSPEAGVSFAASNLPPGLTIDPTTGEISGTPSVSGAYVRVSITATNASGSTKQDITILIYSVLNVPSPSGGRVYQVIDGQPAATPILNATTHRPGGQITLRAVAAPGFYFAGWTVPGGLVEDSETTVTQVDGLTVTANFLPLPDSTERPTNLRITRTNVSRNTTTHRLTVRDNSIGDRLLVFEHRQWRRGGGWGGWNSVKSLLLDGLPRDVTHSMSVLRSRDHQFRVRVSRDSTRFYSNTVSVRAR